MQVLSWLVEKFLWLVDLFLHLDVYLPQIVDTFGLWSYLLMFFVIFMETGFVVTPFLPGDSLLFAAGAVASTVPAFDIKILYPLMLLAAVLGDTVNYSIGHAIGPRAFSGKIKFLKKEYLDRTQKFFDKHGGKTIILARFVPFVRTYAPFMAGVGRMRYSYFISYNLVGGFLWVTLFLFGGYFFGSLEFVAKRFSLVIIVIVLISLVPAIIEYIKARKEKKDPPVEITTTPTEDQLP